MDTNIYTSFVLLQIYDQEINYHYLRRYIKLIRHFKEIEPQVSRKKGFEKHHIFPNNRCSSSFSGDPNNLVLLPLKAHFVVHHLLYKAFSKNRAMMFAFRGFVYGHGKKRRNQRITAKVYEKLKKDYSNFQRERVKNGTHHFLGGEISMATNLKRVANGTHHFLGSELQRKRVKNGTHHFLGGELQRERVKNGTHNLLGLGMPVFDLEQGKYVRIQTQEYHENKSRYLAINSKQYKELKNQMV